MKITFTLLLLSLLFNFGKAQQKYAISDEYGRPSSYGVSSLRSKIPIFLSTDKQTKSIIPFNAVPNDPLGTMVYLLGATNVSVTTRVKKDSLSYYRYSIIENDTSLIQSNSKLSKVDFVWPDGSSWPGYLTMNLGISNVRNKKITVKIYRLPEESKVTTVIIHNKPLRPASLIETSLISKLKVIKTPYPTGPIYRDVNDVLPLKSGISFNVDQKTLGIYLSMKKTDLDFVYQLTLTRRSDGKDNIVFRSGNWSYYSSDDNPSNFIPANYFSEAGTYELTVIPVVGRPSDERIIDSKPVKLLFIVKNRPISFSTVQVLLGGILMAVITAIVVYIIRRNNKKKLLIANRQAEFAKSELNNVRSQLNPHFVFNALAGIQNLMNQNEVEKANGYLSKFARLTRNILDGKQLIALKDEHKLLEDYLAMERLRFNFNYEIRVDTEPDILEVMIPTMLLQPFLENAVKHSMSILGDKGSLLVEFKSVNKDLILSIKDNGKGFDTQKVREGLGLSLCKKRIDLLSQVYTECPIIMDLHSGPNGTTVIIKLNNWL